MENESLVDPSLLCEDRWPLWRYVKHHGRPSGTSGNASWTCTFCERKFKGSYSRVRAHLLKDSRKGITICQSVCRLKITEMLRLEKEASKKRGSQINFGHSQSSFCCNSTSAEALGSAHGECGSKKRKPRGGMDAQRITELDSEIAEMFYSAGLPFNLASNPHFIKAFSLAASLGISGYKPPTYDSLRRKLSEKEENNIESRDGAIAAVCAPDTCSSRDVKDSLRSE